MSSEVKSSRLVPVGAPPDAIVLGTGLVRMPQRMKAGFWLNIAGIALTFVVFMPVLRALR